MVAGPQARRVLVDVRAARALVWCVLARLPWKRWWVRVRTYLVANRVLVAVGSRPAYQAICGGAALRKAMGLEACC